MNITAINGSPKGANSNTSVMIDALLEGFINEDHQINCINLADRNIQFCKGCYSCWSKTPWKCVQKDDMETIIQEMDKTELFIIGTPLYFNNISGTLKVFFDRLTAAGGDPHKSQVPNSNLVKPKYVVVSNCGYPIKEQFAIISLWFNRFTQMTGSEVIAEFYTTSGKVLTQPTSEQEKSRKEYLKFLSSCGKTISEDGTLNESQREMISKSILDF